MTDKPSVNVMLDSDGYLILVNETIYDIRVFYKDNTGKQQSLLCYPRSERKYDRKYEFVTFFDGDGEDKLGLSAKTVFHGKAVRIESKMSEKSWADIADDDTEGNSRVSIYRHSDNIEKSLLGLIIICSKNGYNFQVK